MAKTYYLVNTAIKKYIWVGQDTPTDKAPYLYSDRWIGRILLEWAGQPIMFVDENWVHNRDDDFVELEEPEDAA